jgi:hypothetical protein
VKRRLRWKELDDPTVKRLPGYGPAQARRQWSAVLTATWSGSGMRLTGSGLGDASREESGAEQWRSRAVRRSAWCVSEERERENDARE